MKIISLLLSLSILFISTTHATNEHHGVHSFYQAPSTSAESFQTVSSWELSDTEPEEFVIRTVPLRHIINSIQFIPPENVTQILRKLKIARHKVNPEELNALEDLIKEFETRI